MPQDYGNRRDGSKKGRGFFGPIPVPGTNSVATEAQMDFEMDDRKISAPLLSGNLDRRERAVVVEAMSRDAWPSNDIVEKAQRHAVARQSLGLSAFYDPKVDHGVNWRSQFAKGTR